MITPQDATKRRLIEEAGKVFAEKGFEAATVREICSSAGANLAAINYHFGDKEQLYLEAVQEAHCTGAEDLPQLPPGMPPDEKLRFFIRNLLERMIDPNRPAWHSQLMLREMAQPTKACEALVEGYIRPMANVLLSILDEIVPQTTANEDRFLIGFSIVGQCLFHKVHKPVAKLLVGEPTYEAYTVERLADHIARYSLAALGYAEPFAKPAGEQKVLHSEERR